MQIDIRPILRQVKLNQFERVGNKYEKLECIKLKLLKKKLISHYVRKSYFILFQCIHWFQCVTVSYGKWDRILESIKLNGNYSQSVFTCSKLTIETLDVLLNIFKFNTYC